MRGNLSANPHDAAQTLRPRQLPSFILPVHRHTHTHTHTYLPPRSPTLGHHHIRLQNHFKKQPFLTAMLDGYRSQWLAALTKKKSASPARQDSPIDGNPAAFRSRQVGVVAKERLQAFDRVNCGRNFFGRSLGSFSRE